MNEIYIKQQIENSLIENLNTIIQRQTEDSELFSINLPEIARTLSKPLGSLIVGLAANLITPTIQNYISTIEQIEQKECIEITHDEALKMMIDVVKLDEVEIDSKNEFTEQLIATFDDEYYKNKK